MKYNIDNVDIGGLDWNDYPDFCDAYIESCDINGEEATDEQLDEINNDSQLVYELVEEWMW
jgi:hypothetical protein